MTRDTRFLRLAPSGCCCGGFVSGFDCDMACGICECKPDDEYMSYSGDPFVFVPPFESEEEDKLDFRDELLLRRFVAPDEFPLLEGLGGGIGTGPDDEDDPPPEPGLDTSLRSQSEKNPGGG